MQTLEHTRRELNEKKELIVSVVEELELLTAEEEYPVPKIRFIQENDIEEFLFGNLIKWQKSILENDSIWWGFQDHSFVENFESWIHHTWTTKESANKNYKARVISNVSDIEDILLKKYPKSKRDVRPLSGMDFTSTVWVMGEYMVVVMTKHHPFYLFEIHDEMLTHNMREIIKKLWESTSDKQPYK